jgi:hypothetical protein
VRREVADRIIGLHRAVRSKEQSVEEAARAEGSARCREETKKAEEEAIGVVDTGVEIHTVMVKERRQTEVTGLRERKRRETWYEWDREGQGWKQTEQ